MHRAFHLSGSRLGLGILAVAAGLVGAVRAADEPSLAGTWQGELQAAPGVSLRIVFVVEVDAKGETKATMQSPDQTPLRFPVARATAKAGEITWEIDSPKATFTGKLDKDGKAIEGNWKQGPGSLPLRLVKSDPKKSTAAALPAELNALWEGKLEVGAGLTLRVVLKISKDKDGKQVVVFRSPDQTPQDIPVGETSFQGKTLSAKIKAIGAEFQGDLDESKSKIVGTWRQGGGELPLTLAKAEKESEAKRPQTPKPPFPYQSVEVTYPGGREGIKLAGTLTIPKGDGPFPAAILISGSGPQDRDETLFQHKPFAVIADDLTKRGVAVLRVDDRGTAKSTGDFASATSLDFAADVVSGLRYLATRKEIDPKRLGLVGHSEGGLIAPIVAADHPDQVAFIVLLAGPGLPGSEVVRKQSTDIAFAMGAKPDSIALQSALVEQLTAIVAAEKDDAKAKTLIREAFAKMMEKLDEKERKAFETQAEAAKQRLDQFATPWFRFFLTHDPRTPLARVTCPVLALNGEKDLQVHAGDNLGAISTALAKAGNQRVATKELKGLNHLFQTCKTGAPAEYASIEETVAPSALAAIGDWIVDVTGLAKR
ncbi:MAG: alpha/beta hydrolase [Isosphaeraceae bacterium]|nr:alpha/beta hydrolase [Isosphaeraceae bacterium]